MKIPILSIIFTLVFCYSYATEDLITESPQNPLEYEPVQTKQIHVYIYDVTYINGVTIKGKISANVTPDEYLHRYKIYIKHIDNKKKISYTILEFEEKFGKIGVLQLQQGVFGKDEYDMVLMNRKKRGMEKM